MKEVKKVYGYIIEKANSNDAVENRVEVKTMISDASDSTVDSAMRYTIFETAKDVALVKGDCETAMLALRELDRRFIDFEFWDETVDAVLSSGRALARSGDQNLARELDLILRTLIRDASGVKFYKSKDKEVDEISKLQKVYESALEKLTSDPENANANMQKGRYLIVVNRDFKGALKCWKFSGNETLLDIIEAEEDPDGDVSLLAQRWQNLGKDPGTLFGRRCYEHAINLLETAGLRKKSRSLRALLKR